MRGTKKVLQHKPVMAIAPGETLLEILESQGMSQTELAQRMGRPLKLINEIIKGKTAITPETSLQLEIALGVEAAFWNKLESEFQEVKARQALEEIPEEETVLSKEYPYKDMATNGWIESTADTVQQTKNLLNYFAVTSLKNVIEYKALDPVLYRISEKRKINPAAVSAWLRKGVIDSQKITTKAFSEEKLRKIAAEIREMNAANDPKIFVPKITEMLASVGVSFVITKSLPNAPVSGVARWLTGEKALIQLSIYGKSADKFWFSLFHEIGHLLLHGKKLLNIGFTGDSDSSDVREAQANEYARDLLVPKDEYQKFIKESNFGEKSVLSFAKKIRIHPGTIVGRLQLEGHIGYNSLNHLRGSYEWGKE